MATDLRVNGLVRVTVNTTRTSLTCTC